MTLAVQPAATTSATGQQRLNHKIMKGICRISKSLSLFYLAAATGLTIYAPSGRLCRTFSETREKSLAYCVNHPLVIISPPAAFEQIE